MAILPFGPWEPDRTQFDASVSPSVVNCLPTASGWGGLPQFVAVSQALPAAPRGAVYARTSDGAFKIFCGTTTALYQLDTSDYSWTVVTRTSGGAYSVPEGDNWSFRQFGTNLYATNIGDVLQVIDVDSGTNFAAASGSPPQAKYVGSAGDFLILAHTANSPQEVRTSALGNAEFWTEGLRLSGGQILPDGEDIQGLLSGERGAYIFQRRAIRLLEVTSSADYPFAVRVVNPSRGVLAPLSIAAIGPNMFAYLAADGFSQGVEGLPIGAEKVDRWFQAQLDTDKMAYVVGCADPYNKIFWWQAQLPDDTYFMIGYNWQLKRWCYSDQNVVNLVDLVTPAITWDGIENLFATWEDANIAWDSRLISGGLPTFAGFNSDYKLGYFTGLNMAATLKSAVVPLA